jgi:hypothetical protein
MDFENLSDKELKQIAFDLQIRGKGKYNRDFVIIKINKLKSLGSSKIKEYIQNKVEKRKIRNCNNDSTSVGNDVDELSNDELYIYKDVKGLIFCFDKGDIEYILSTKKNPLTNAPIEKGIISDMKTWVDNYPYIEVLTLSESIGKYINIGNNSSTVGKFDEKIILKKKYEEIQNILEEKKEKYTNVEVLDELDLASLSFFISSPPFGKNLEDDVDKDNMLQVKNYVADQILMILRIDHDKAYLISGMIQDIYLLYKNNIKSLAALLEIKKQLAIERGDDPEYVQVFLQYDEEELIKLFQQSIENEDYEEIKRLLPLMDDGTLENEFEDVISKDNIELFKLFVNQDQMETIIIRNIEKILKYIIEYAENGPEMFVLLYQKLRNKIDFFNNELLTIIQFDDKEIFKLIIGDKNLSLIELNEIKEECLKNYSYNILKYIQKKYNVTIEKKDMAYIVKIKNDTGVIKRAKLNAYNIIELFKKYFSLEDEETKKYLKEYFNTTCVIGIHDIIKLLLDFVDMKTIIKGLNILARRNRLDNNTKLIRFILKEKEIDPSYGDNDLVDKTMDVPTNYKMMKYLLKNPKINTLEPQKRILNKLLDPKTKGVMDFIDNTNFEPSREALKQELSKYNKRAQRDKKNYEIIKKFYGM